MTAFRLIAPLLFLAASTLHLPAAGGDELIEQLDRPNRAVNDYADILSASSESRLEGLLTDLEQKTGAAVVVVTLDSMQGGQIDDFTNRLYEKWGIGKSGEDAGAMLLVALAERKMRIEVGYGLEAVIPDGRAGQIRDDYVLAYFKRGEMQKGVEQGTLAIATALADHYGVQLSERPEPRGNGIPLPFIFFIFILLVVFIRGYFNDGNDGGGFYGRRYGRRRYYGGYHGGGSFRSGGGGGFGGGGGGGFGGFGGGMSGGGGASGGW